MSVHQHWDPLEACLVGKSYPPEFYEYIKNPKVRNVFERIAIENAYEEMLIIMKEQGDDKEFSVALEEAVYIHDLDEDMEKALIEMYDNQDSPYYA